MSARADRLLALVQALRSHRRAVGAGTLAAQLGVSERTVYRDIDTLRASGIDIGAAPGVGFMLRDHAFLPPLAFSPAEVDALALGLQFVQARGDAPMRTAAADALAKIRAVLPPASAAGLEAPAFVTGPGTLALREDVLAPIRSAMARERKLLIRYRNLAEQASERIIWPILIGVMEQTALLAAWCELRQAIRHFRLDRIAAVELLEQPYGVARSALLSQWQREHAGGP